MDIRQSRVREEYGKEEGDLFPKDEASERKKRIGTGKQEKS